MCSRVRRLGSAARLTLFLAFATPAAFAQSAGIDWERRAGAEGCASAEEIAARVERVLDRRVFAAEKSAGNTIVVRGTASRDARGYRVEIAVVDRARREKETRLIRVAGDDCRKVDAALALMIAM